MCLASVVLFGRRDDALTMWPQNTLEGVNRPSYREKVKGIGYNSVLRKPPVVPSLKYPHRGCALVNEMVV